MPFHAGRSLALAAIERIFISFASGRVHAVRLQSRDVTHKLWSRVNALPTTQLIGTCKYYQEWSSGAKQSGTWYRKCKQQREKEKKKNAFAGVRRSSDFISLDRLVSLFQLYFGINREHREWRNENAQSSSEIWIKKRRPKWNERNEKKREKCLSERKWFNRFNLQTADARSLLLGALSAYEWTKRAIFSVLFLFFPFYSCAAVVLSPTRNFGLLAAHPISVGALHPMSQNKPKNKIIIIIYILIFFSSSLSRSHSRSLTTNVAKWTLSRQPIIKLLLTSADDEIHAFESKDCETTNSRFCHCSTCTENETVNCKSDACAQSGAHSRANRIHIPSLRIDISHLMNAANSSWLLHHRKVSIALDCPNEPFSSPCAWRHWKPTAASSARGLKRGIKWTRNRRIYCD